jgi:hypothetical protein
MTYIKDKEKYDFEFDDCNKYSKYGLYSSQLFLVNGIINWNCGFRVLNICFTFA